MKPKTLIISVFTFALLTLGILIYGSLASAEAVANDPLLSVSSLHPRAKFIKKLIELDISDKQKETAANVIKSHRESIRGAVDNATEARKNLFEVIHQEQFDEQLVRDTAQEVAAATEELAVIRAMVLNELRPILTPEQQSIVKELRTEVSQRLEEKFALARSLADTWIETHSTN